LQNGSTYESSTARNNEIVDEVAEYTSISVNRINIKGKEEVSNDKKSRRNKRHENDIKY